MGNHYKLPKNGGVSGKQRQVKQADSLNSLAGMPNAQSSSNCPDSGSTPTKAVHHLMWHAPMKSAAHYLFGVSNGEVPPGGVLPQHSGPPTSLHQDILKLAEWSASCVWGCYANLVTMVLGQEE